MISLRLRQADALDDTRVVLRAHGAGPDGRVIGIEVKAGVTVTTEDLAGLRHVAARLGDRFVCGYVLYTGQQTLPFGEKLRAIPLDALWRLAP